MNKKEGKRIKLPNRQNKTRRRRTKRNESALGVTKQNQDKTKQRKLSKIIEVYFEHI